MKCGALPRPLLLHVSPKIKGADGNVIPWVSISLTSLANFLSPPPRFGARVVPRTEGLPTTPFVSGGNVTSAILLGVDNNLYKWRRQRSRRSNLTWTTQGWRVHGDETGPNSNFDSPKSQLWRRGRRFDAETPWALIPPVRSSHLLRSRHLRAAVAVGMYLPFATSATIFIGRAVRRSSSGLRAQAYLPKRIAGPGLLYISGDPGGAIAGLLLAIPHGLGGNCSTSVVATCPSLHESMIMAIMSTC